MMLRIWLLALPLVVNVSAIKVLPPTEEHPSTEASTPEHYTNDESQSPSAQNEHTTTDSYQVQPDEQPDPKESPKDGILIPARYLLPPRQDAQVYSYPTEPQTEEGEWTPMVQSLPKVASGPSFSPNEKPLKNSYGAEIPLGFELPKENIGQWFNTRLAESETQETQNEGEKEENPEPNDFQIIIPSTHLQPPRPDSVPNVDFDTSAPATELQPPDFRNNVVFRSNLKKLKPILPTISLEMKPPTPSQPKKYRHPTVLYPKKYSKFQAFKPIPIPMRDYHEGDIEEVPKAKPVKFFKPTYNLDEDYVAPKEDEKKLVKYQQAEEKRKFQEEEEAKKQQEFLDSTVEEAFASPESSAEQQASETGFYGNGRDSYAAPLPAQAPVAEEAPAPAERTEFRMHGLQGPHSYKFGYDTGKGKNRQFRYEERNNEGHVRGHYGYVDRHGKTQVVNYDAHPEFGFHAEGPFGKV